MNKKRKTLTMPPSSPMSSSGQPTQRQVADGETLNSPQGAPQATVPAQQQLHQTMRSYETDVPQSLMVMGSQPNPEAMARGAQMPLQGPPLPPNSPAWKYLARTLAQSLEAAVAMDDMNPHARAAVTRAWAAWSMGGYTPAQIRTVANLVDQACRACKARPAQRTHIVTQILPLVRNGLPPQVRSWLGPDAVRAILMRLAAQPEDPELRVVAICQLLGWAQSAVSWAEQAIAIAQEAPTG